MGVRVLGIHKVGILRILGIIQLPDMIPDIPVILCVFIPFFSLNILDFVNEETNVSSVLLLKRIGLCEI